MIFHYESIGGCLPGLETVDGYTTKSMTQSHCIVKPTVTFPASEHHHPLTGTKLYCLVTEAHRCKKIPRVTAQGCRGRT